VFTRLEAALTRPSTLDWPAYYEELTQSINPSLPVPRAVVDELRRRLPPRQVRSHTRATVARSSC
jgi:hypothetical protein